MRLALVVPAPVHPIHGGAERAWTGLASAFNVLTPHRCDVVAVPSPEGDLAEVAASYGRFLDLDASAFDAVLSTKYPGWMVDHPIHDVYLFHRLRGLDDTYPGHLPLRMDDARRDLAELRSTLRRPPTWDTARAAVNLVVELTRARSDDPAFAHPGPVGRELVVHLDSLGLAPRRDRRFSAISETVRARSRSLRGPAAAQIVPMPTSLPGLRPGTYEYFFTASRLDAAKRIDLLINAYRKVPGDLALVIAGEGTESARLEALAAGDDRVHLIGRVDDSELVDHYARALAVPFLPIDEDWGLVAVEAFSAATAVVTCRDSGGPTELVLHEETGLVVEPTPVAVAAALSRFVTDPSLAQRLGSTALARSETITWERVVEALTPDTQKVVHAQATTPKPTFSWRRGRRKLVVLSTFRIEPALHGGQVRCSHLARELRHRFDVELVCLGAGDDEATSDVLAFGLLQHVAPRSEGHRRLEAEWDGRAGMHVGDVVAGLAISRSPAFEDIARRALADADVVLLSGPYLIEIAERFAPGRPLVYEAHNCELDLKRSVLPPGAASDELLRRIADLESRSVHRAAVRTVCSAEDGARLATLYDVPQDSFLIVPSGADVVGTRFVSPPERRRAERSFLDRFVADHGRRSQLCLFIGSHHPPNVDAGRRLLALAPSVPEALVVLAGGHTEALVDDRLPANVITLGPISEPLKRTLLGSAGVALNPMALGSGTNLKLLEYLAAGAPTVTTAFGARGVEIVDGIHALIEPLENFGPAIRRVRDIDLDGMPAAGRELVETSYSWGPVARALADAIHRAT